MTSNEIELSNNINITDKGWRPMKWTDPKVLEELINEYFRRCDEWYVVEKRDLLYKEHLEDYYKELELWEMEEKWFRPQEPKEKWNVIQRDIPTITGLSIFLWCDIDTIKNYSRKDEFIRPIKEAYAKVQQSYEERLHGNNPTGAIFALKNFWWVDKEDTGWINIKDSNVIVQLPPNPKSQERLE